MGRRGRIAGSGSKRVWDSYILLRHPNTLPWYQQEGSCCECQWRLCVQNGSERDAKARIDQRKKPHPNHRLKHLPPLTGPQPDRLREKSPLPSPRDEGIRNCHIQTGITALAKTLSPCFHSRGVGAGNPETRTEPDRWGRHGG